MSERSRPLWGLLVLAGIAVVYVAKPLLAPIVVAILLKLVLAPPARWLRRAGLPAGLAAALVVLATLGGAGYGVYWFSGEVTDWARAAPERVRAAKDKLDAWRGQVAEVGETMDEVQGATDDAALPVRVQRGDRMTSLLDTTWQAVASLLIVGFLLFFLLANDDAFLRRLVEALPKLHDKRLAVRSAREIESRISRYLFTVTIINAGLGVAIGTALWLLGVPNPVLWGTIAGLLNFIPYAGFVVGAALVGLVSVATFDSTLDMVLPPLVYVVINGFEGNVFTPMVIGRSLALNPTAVFLSVLVWGFLWGVVGVLLAVPLLITLRVVLEASERTRRIGSFLAS